MPHSPCRRFAHRAVWAEKRKGSVSEMFCVHWSCPPVAPGLSRKVAQLTGGHSPGPRWEGDPCEPSLVVTQELAAGGQRTSSMI